MFRIDERPQAGFFLPERHMQAHKLGAAILENLLDLLVRLLGR